MSHFPTASWPHSPLLIVLRLWGNCVGVILFTVLLHYVTCSIRMESRSQCSFYLQSQRQKACGKYPRESGSVLLSQQLEKWEQSELDGLPWLRFPLRECQRSFSTVAWPCFCGEFSLLCVHCLLCMGTGPDKHTAQVWANPQNLEIETQARRTNVWKPRGKGVNWETGVDIHTLLCIK